MSRPLTTEEIFALPVRKEAVGSQDDCGLAHIPVRRAVSRNINAFQTEWLDYGVFCARCGAKLEESYE